MPLKIDDFEANIGPIEAAKRGLYGPLTRSEEVWAPNALLCKRCNVRDPYKGMHDGKSSQFESHFDKRMKMKFGGLLVNEKKNDAVQSRGEVIAAMLEATEQNEREPPILELKQLKTWNNYLMESEHKQRAKKIKVSGEEMKDFIDGILNDSDSEKKHDEQNGDEMEADDNELFKSIFENEGDDDSESEASEAPQADAQNKAEKDEIDEDEVDFESKRKKLKFVAKSQRISNGISAGFCSFGNVKKLPNVKIEHEDEDEDKNEVIWAIMEDDSTNSDTLNDAEDNSRRHKREKRKMKKHKKSKSGRKKRKRKRYRQA